MTYTKSPDAWVDPFEIAMLLHSQFGGSVRELFGRHHLLKRLRTEDQPLIYFRKLMQCGALCEFVKFKLSSVVLGHGCDLMWGRTKDGDDIGRYCNHENS